MGCRTELDRIVSRYVMERTPGLSFLVTRGDETLFRGAYGMADLEAGAPVREDDNFIIASNTKQFTCVAILMLRERGLLDLDEPIERFFPDFPAYRKHVTVRQLMCHTSGIHEYFEGEARKSEALLYRADTARLLEIIRGFGEPEFEPDTCFSYCNSAYVMLGDIVRQLSGKPFGRFLETEIFAPLGMKRTFAPDYMDQKDPYQVRGYQAGPDGTFTEAPYDMLEVGYADGNISSNVDDLRAWHRYLFENGDETLLSRASLSEAFRPHRLKNGRAVNYGFGFFLGPIEGKNHLPYDPSKREVWHTGGTVGFISRCSRFVDDSVTAVMLTNYNGIARDEVFFAVLDQILKS